MFLKLDLYMKILSIVVVCFLMSCCTNCVCANSEITAKSVCKSPSSQKITKKMHVFPNGLTLVCIPKHVAPVGIFAIFFKCGSTSDKLFKSGVAHYLEHMAFLSKFKGNSLSDFLDQIGAQFNAMTSFGAMCFYEKFPVEHFEKIAAAEAERMFKLEISSAFESERSAILEERSMRYDDSPSGIMDEVTLSTINNRKAGGIGIIGHRHEIEKLKEEDLREYHRNWFVPNNAIIVVGGDIKYEEAKKIIEKYFGNIPEKKLPDSVKNNKEIGAIKDADVKNKNITAHYTEYVYQVPFKMLDNLRKSVALEIAVQIINTPSHFCYKTFTEVWKKISSISINYLSGMFASDFVLVSISCKSATHLENSKEIWDYLRVKINSNPITKDQLSDFKNRKLLADCYKKDDVFKVVFETGLSMAHGYTFKQIEEMESMEQSITLEECCDVLKEVFTQPIATISMAPQKIQ